MSDLEQARAKAGEHRAEFLRQHRAACIAFGKYCEAMEQVQRLTTQNATRCWAYCQKRRTNCRSCSSENPPY